MGLSPTFVKLVSWYDNEWGYRYISLSQPPPPLSRPPSHCNRELGPMGWCVTFLWWGFLQQPSVGPDRAHGIGGGQQLKYLQFLAAVNLVIRVEY